MTCLVSHPLFAFSVISGKASLASESVNLGYSKEIPSTSGKSVNFIKKKITTFALEQAPSASLRSCPSRPPAKNDAVRKGTELYVFYWII
ncbi:hypothetical protein KIN20_003008 [Parelaphostrongylus tenuis]|uniref:Uncharacterized protein n=1 Tax=Parelaphostrongylus tenuis TaxID=148309 RepID=A0AAD5MF14_PARTN|nr:hypothetical protein KIN20_003008 [Parelaphostrongylus tenuis]